MLLRAVRVGWVAVVALAGCGRAPESPPTEQGPLQTVQDERRFLGVVGFGGDSARVEIRQVGLRPGAKVDSLPLPFRGQVLLTLEAGSVTVRSAGGSALLTQGQVWTVAAGRAVALEAGRDAASLQVVIVEE